jgi:hypothetical protein
LDEAEGEDVVAQGGEIAQRVHYGLDEVLIGLRPRLRRKYKG